MTLEFDRVSYRFPGGAAVLSDVTFALTPGAIVALVGRSGSGKTTVLRLANALLLPTSGTVRVGGRDTRDWDPIRLRRLLGYALQDAGLLPHLSVRDNLGLLPRLERWPAPRIEARVREVLALVQLPADHYAARWPDELSGGQRQRVGLARALMLDPDLLLLDEPFGALDPITRAELQGELQRIQAVLARTMLLVTHDLHEAFRLAARVLVLHEGRVIADAAPDGLRASAHAEVQALLDTMELARGAR